MTSLLFTAQLSRAEELNCQVEVNADKIGNANKDVFKALQQAVADYMNTTKWTNLQYGTQEKINCKLFFTINTYDANTNKMVGELQIQSQRPVYNSSYLTTVFNFRDTKVEFTYQQNEPLVYSEQEMQSNLTAILNFYAFFLIALDEDTFSPMGGTPMYDRVSTIVRQAQSSGETGWKAFEDDKNRSALLSAYYDKQATPMRELLYKYHRLGLDIMSTTPSKGRAAITEALSALKTINETSPMAVSLSIFKDTKLDELVNVYSKANNTERETVFDLLSPLWPTEQERLSKIKTPDTNL